MKKYLFLLSTLLLFAFSCSGSKNSISVGSTVAAQWQGGTWYLAKVEGVEGDKYKVLYDDGTDGMVSKGETHLIPKDQKLGVGDTVLGAWSGARLYSGKVKSAEEDGYLIEWDDGSEPSHVANDKVLKWPQ